VRPYVKHWRLGDPPQVPYAKFVVAEHSNGLIVP